MTKLTIKDLPVSEELDRRAMNAVRGGNASLASSLFPGLDLSAFAMSLTPQQFINQTQTTLNENGSNIAFAEGLAARSNVAPKQDAKNITNFNFGVPGDVA